MEGLACTLGLGGVSRAQEGAGLGGWALAGLSCYGRSGALGLAGACRAGAPHRPGQGGLGLGHWASEQLSSLPSALVSPLKTRAVGSQGFWGDRSNEAYGPRRHS